MASGVLNGSPDNPSALHEQLFLGRRAVWEVSGLFESFATRRGVGFSSVSDCVASVHGDFGGERLSGCVWLVDRDDWRDGDSFRKQLGAHD